MALKFDPTTYRVPRDPILEYKRKHSNSIRCRVCGPDTAKNKIVLVMGMATPLEGWNEFQSLLQEASDDYQSVAFDNAGSGTHQGSFFFPSIYSMSADAWDIIDNFLHWDKVHVVAVSMGGMIAMEMCLLHPNRVISLSIVNTHTGGIRNVIPPRKGMYLFFKPLTQSNIYDQLESSLLLLFGSKITNSITHSQYFMDRIHYAIKTRPKATLHGTILQLVSICTYWISPWRLEYLKHSNIPILVSLGSEDILVNTRNSHYISNKLNAKLELYDDCGHGLQIQEAEKFYAQTKEHFEISSEKYSERKKTSFNLFYKFLCWFDYLFMKLFWLFCFLLFLYWIKWTFSFTFVKFQG